MGYRDENPRRKLDETNTRIVNDFLDRNFYTEENGFNNIERVIDKPRQLQGIDIEFDFNGKSYVSDEKAATTYINKGLGTFSFELAFLNRRNEIMDGWLINPDIVTDSYVLVWIDDGDVDIVKAGKYDVQVLKGVDAIHVAEVALVKKRKVVEYLDNLGWNIDKLRAKCDAILDNPEGQNMGNIWRNGCKFSYSKRKYEEEPVNVLVPRNKLIEMSDFHMHYTA